MSISARSLVAALAGPLLLLPTPGGQPARGAPSPVAPSAVEERAGPSADPGRDAGPGAATSTRGPRWAWPLAPVPPVLRHFRAPASPYGPGHRGADLAATAGAEVVAVEGGVVSHAGRVAGRGTVTVAHPGGLSSTYEPVRPRVATGTSVERGDRLGALETPGGVPAGGHCLLTSCLHLGARRGGAYVDPLLLLRGERVRLLPLPAGQPTTG